jgi:hypothetical protein
MLKYRKRGDDMLIGHWAFETNLNALFALTDLSGYNNSLILSNAGFSTAFGLLSSGSRNINNGYIGVTNMLYGKDKWSISFWHKNVSTMNAGSFLLFFDTFLNVYRNFSGEYILKLGMTDYTLYSNTTTDWTFINLIYNGTDIKIYKNGELESTHGVTIEIPNTPYIYFGSNTVEGYHDMYFTDLRFYDKVLTQYQIDGLFKLRILYYTNDMEFLDTSGYKKFVGFLPANNPPLKITDTAYGGGGYSLNGEDQYIAANSLITGLKSFWTINVYLKYHYRPEKNLEYIIGGSNTTGNFAKISFNHNGYIAYSYPVGTFYNFTATSSSIDNKNKMLTFVGTGTEVKLYIDGIYNSSVSLSTSNFNFNFLRLGNSWSTNDRSTKADIYNFSLYLSVLSDNDIKQLYEDRGIIDSDGNFYIKQLNSSIYNGTPKITAQSQAVFSDYIENNTNSNSDKVDINDQGNLNIQGEYWEVI